MTAAAETRPLAGLEEKQPMSWLPRLFRSSRESSSPEPLRALTCSSCGHAFQVGVDAGLITDEQVADKLRDAGMAVPVSDGPAQPELVQHVTLDGDLLKQTEEAISIVARALSRGKKRFWTCGECKAVNAYPRYEAQLKGGPPPEKTYTFVRQDITDPEKQFAMGCTFFHGEKVAQDYKEANKWFRRAAEQGHREAQFFLAVNYHGGHGVPEDTSEAYRWYLRAAEQGHCSAQRTVGVAYLNGEVMRKDIGAGVRWLKKAADQGDGGALYNLGVCYYNGQGVQQDDGTALDLFKRASAAGQDGAAQILKQLEST